MDNPHDEDQKHGPKILLVEDDELLGPLLKRQLEALPASVYLVKDAAHFLEAISFQEEVFDLAVVDIGLPGLPGDQLISWIRSSVDDWILTLPILVVTGTPERTQDMLSSAGGRIQVLAKPYRVGELQSAALLLLRGSVVH